MPGLGPAAEPLLFRQKWPKPLTPSLAKFLGRTQDREERTNLLRSDKGPQIKEGVRPEGQPAGVLEN